MEVRTHVHVRMHTHSLDPFFNQHSNLKVLILQIVKELPPFKALLLLTLGFSTLLSVIPLACLTAEGHILSHALTSRQCGCF